MKKRRQAKIIELISQNPIETQEELQDMLMKSAAIAVLFLGMAGPVHGAVRTVTAAGGFPLLFLPDQRPQNENHDGGQSKANQDGSDMGAYPLQHGKSLL